MLFVGLYDALDKRNLFKKRRAILKICNSCTMTWKDVPYIKMLVRFFIWSKISSLHVASFKYYLHMQFERNHTILSLVTIYMRSRLPEFSKFEPENWPTTATNSPDLNPVDFWVRGVLYSKNSVERPKTLIVESAFRRLLRSDKSGTRDYELIKTHDGHVEFHLNRQMFIISVHCEFWGNVNTNWMSWLKLIVIIE